MRWTNFQHWSRDTGRKGQCSRPYIHIKQEISQTKWHVQAGASSLQVWLVGNIYLQEQPSFLQAGDTYMIVCLCVCVCVCVRACMCVCVSMCVCACMHVFVHARLHVYLCMHVCTCTCKNACMQVYMRECMNMYSKPKHCQKQCYTSDLEGEELCWSSGLHMRKHCRHRRQELHH